MEMTDLVVEVKPDCKFWQEVKGVSRPGVPHNRRHIHATSTSKDVRSVAQVIDEHVREVVPSAREKVVDVSDHLTRIRRHPGGLPSRRY